MKNEVNGISFEKKLEGVMRNIDFSIDHFEKAIKASEETIENDEKVFEFLKNNIEEKPEFMHKFIEETESHIESIKDMLGKHKEGVNDLKALKEILSKEDLGENHELVKLLLKLGKI